MKYCITIFLLITSIYCNAQQMDQGFTYLEEGAYQNAVSFFKAIVTKYPDNKTGRLCLGRAIGLSGDPEKAKKIFIDLLEDFPGDFELELNYAEALLWNKEFQVAKSYYNLLLTKEPQHFSVVLGYANTLSNLKEYNDALVFIKRALALEPGNRNAQISQKYIRLGKAAQLVEQEQTSEALMILSENFKTFSNDHDTRQAIINLQLKQNNFIEAEKSILELKDSVAMFTNLSLLFHKRKKDKEALNYARLGQDFIENSSSDADKISVAERYIQALLWTGNIREVKKELKTLEKRFPDAPFLIRLKATLGMYTGQLGKSIDFYSLLLAKDSTSFDGNLGIANAHKGQGDLPKALYFAQKTLEYYPNQADAKALVKEIKTRLAPSVTTKVMYTIDNGKNEARGVNVTGTIPISHNWTTTVGYGYRTTENKLSNEMAYNTNAQLGLDHRLYNNTWICSKIGFIKATAPSTNFQDVNGSIFIKSRPLPLQYLELGYSRNLQNFNATLIDEQIFMNNYTVNYNLGTNVGLGWYTGYTYTKQTDANTRNLLFTSLYYNIGKRPNIKGGLNYQYLAFKNQVPTLYFSPSKYQALELFLEVSGSTGKLNYRINGACGFQYLMKESRTALFRIEGKLDYTFSRHLQGSAYAKYSNIASATATGFEFSEIGIQLRLQLNKR